MSELFAPLCPGLIIECFTPVELLAYAMLNVSLAVLSIHAVQRRPCAALARCIVVASGTFAGSLVGFCIGARFPRGGDPHYRMIVGWFESGAWGFVVGAAAALVIASWVARRVTWRAPAQVFSVVAGTIASADMFSVYWLGRYFSLLRLVKWTFF